MVVLLGVKPKVSLHANEGDQPDGARLAARSRLGLVLLPAPVLRWR